VVIRVGEYRLFRQAGGRAAFAHIVVELRPCVGGPDVIFDAVPGAAETVIPECDEELFRAAVDGCREALRILSMNHVDVDNWQVRISRLVMTVADTTPDAVQVAAGMATAEAFNATDRVDLVYDQIWRICPAAKSI
jgi:hypothetical protein